MTQNSKQYKFEEYNNHYLISMNDSREIKHVLNITSKDISGLNCESILQHLSSQNKTSSVEDDTKYVTYEDKYKLKLSEELTFSFHTFKNISFMDKCYEFGLIHTKEEKSKEELQHKVMKLNSDEYKQLTEIKKYILI